MYDHTAPRRRLTDILTSGQCGNLRDAWNRTEAAVDFAPLPAGIYEYHVHSVELFNARTGTPGVKIRFDVCEGNYVGRALFHDCWLTSAALPQTKRDLGKLGITRLEQLEETALPPGRIRCKVHVALRRADDGTEYNRVRSFAVVGTDEPERDPFAPTDGEADDASFDFGANVTPEGGAS